ncbi:DNA/RNA non-specific endonuclease [Streptomyces anulatus]|uniref:DNA/RNA non-specific endonuclease n=1 Tax=Streptomyces anulatus TaxID=1892 RepID=UPI00341E4A23
MRSQAGTGKTSAADRPSRARGPAESGVVPPAGFLAQQSSSGNAAVVQMLRAAGHLPAQDRHRHRHGDDCGHEQAGAEVVQRASTTRKEGAVVSFYEPSKRNAPRMQDLPIERPAVVSGPIDVPKDGTSDRGAAPEPLSVTSLQSAYKAALASQPKAAGKSKPRRATPNNADVWKDLFGGAGYDRGHIMGLEVGGTDETENIVPQWSLNQQSGEWRQIEKDLVSLGSGTVTFTPHYPSAHGNYRAVMIPTSIDVQVQGGQGHTWHNDPNLNDLFRAGQDPESPAESYKYAKRDLHGAGKVTVDEDQMHRIAQMAYVHERAIADTHNDYVEQRSSGQAPGTSRLDTLMQPANLPSVPKASRQKLIELYIRCGWVTPSGANYVVDDPTFTDASSSSDGGASAESESDSDVSMLSVGGAIPGVPFGQMQLGGDSGSDSEYTPMSQ